MTPHENSQAPLTFLGYRRGLRAQPLNHTSQTVFHPHTNYRPGKHCHRPHLKSGTAKQKGWCLLYYYYHCDTFCCERVELDIQKQTRNAEKEGKGSTSLKSRSHSWYFPNSHPSKSSRVRAICEVNVELRSTMCV